MLTMQQTVLGSRVTSGQYCSVSAQVPAHLASSACRLHSDKQTIFSSSSAVRSGHALFQQRQCRRPGRSRSLLCQAAALESMEQQYAKTAAKALQINLNPSTYGTFAEIGAGQEVARWFFRVGGAAGTIAKSISAYDMSVSDSMYGACARYVTKDRLEAMLDYEYLQCNLTLRRERGNDTAFFAFADTVVAKAYNRDNECHGWLGLKYQTEPGGPSNQILIHVRMLDNTAQAQAEALGVLGVNLIDGALNKSGDHYAIIGSLMDDLSRSRVEMDLVDFSGPAYEHVDNRFAALTLVQKGLCDAALFSPQGSMLIPQETLYKKNVMLVRGRFRPFTLLHNDMLLGAANQFFCEPEGSVDTEIQTVSDTYDECVFRDDTLVLLEMTTRDMMERDPDVVHDPVALGEASAGLTHQAPQATDGGDLLDWTSDKGIQMDAFIQRIDALSTMGYTVLLSNFRRYFKLASYISTHTNQSIVIAMGVPSLKREKVSKKMSPSPTVMDSVGPVLQELFSERHYADLDGGILEGFGRLLKFDLKIYVYPTVDEASGELQTAESIRVAPSVQKLYDYIRERGTLVPIKSYNRELLMHTDVSKAVTESIRSGTPLWESLVPKHVAEEIKAKNLLGYRQPASPRSVLDGSGQIGNGHASNGSSNSSAFSHQRVTSSK